MPDDPGGTGNYMLRRRMRFIRYEQGLVHDGHGAGRRAPSPKIVDVPHDEIVWSMQWPEA